MGQAMRIQGSVALVTGSNRGLGLAFAEELRNRGVKVYAAARNPDSIDLPGVVPVRLDVTDAAVIQEAADRCGDVTLLVNNAGIGTVNEGTLDPAFIDSSREMFETNFYGMVRVSQVFGPIIAQNGGGAIINVLSDATWFSRPIVASYSATKSAAWSFTNALRLDLRGEGVQVVGLHAGFIDTDLARGIDAEKSRPRDVAATALEGLENGKEEVLADEQSRLVKSTLSTDRGYYLDPPDIV
ncbi:SDR family oxidoreductase [Streptomyces sp. R41]|uniref:SDR family oxidoreductase n=1 Tax=Streptomyces sp. R41 TaxID=3238632 RepID=A0AB39R815_9ACTN